MYRLKRSNSSGREVGQGLWVGVERCIVSCTLAMVGFGTYYTDGEEYHIASRTGTEEKICCIADRIFSPRTASHVPRCVPTRTVHHLHRTLSSRSSPYTHSAHNNCNTSPSTRPELLKPDSQASNPPRAISPVPQCLLPQHNFHVHLLQVHVSPLPVGDDERVRWRQQASPSTKA